MHSETFPIVTALEKLHAKHALPGFSDRSAEEKEIESATTDITRVCYVIFRRILSFVSCSSLHCWLIVSRRLSYITGFSAMPEINSENWL